MNTPEKHSTAITARHHDSAAHQQWWIVIGLVILSLALGTSGFLRLPAVEGKSLGFLDALYNSLQLFHMHLDHVPRPLPVELQIARFLSPLVLMVTLLKGFIFVARSHRHAFIHRSQQGHVVICGLSQKGLQLARQRRKNGIWVVVVEIDPHNELLSVCDDEGIYYRIGDAAEPAVLSSARVAHAAEIIVVTAEDETNLRIAMQVYQLVPPGQTPRPKCHVHLENIHLREKLQRHLRNEAAKPSGCDLDFFDVYDAEARRVLVEQLPLDGNGIGQDDPRSVHVVILGFGRMGRSLALRAAKLGHFANGKKLRLSVVDRSAEKHGNHFLFHYPMLEKEAICRLQFHQLDAQSPAVRGLVAGWAAEPDTLLHFFVCLDDNALAIEVTLRFQEMLVNRPGCNLWVRIKKRDSLVDILKLASETSGPRIVPFGMVEDSCCDRAIQHEFNEGIARFAHDEFVQHRLVDSNRKPETDPALRPWAELTEDLRESSRQQADHIAVKLRAIRCETAPKSDARAAVTAFSAADIELLAEVEHTRWNAERWLAGWRYGVPSDKKKRINENLVSWAELHDSIRKYDREAVVEIPKRLAAASPPLKVVRKNQFDAVTSQITPIP